MSTLPLRCSRSRAAFLLGASLAAMAASSCTEEPITVPLRSMQSSGPLSFVCLGYPTADARDFALPLDVCTAAYADNPNDYSIPHLYALVTQPISGEVAVVDLNTDGNAVLDQDTAVPGASFLPVGAAPTDIVSTPGSMASFVTSAQTGFEGIYAMPSGLIRGAGARLSSWPACSLPAAPGAMVLAVDGPDEGGAIRPSCDADYGEDDPSGCTGDGVGHCHGDLSYDAEIAGRPGRYKLLVAIPEFGGIAVIDAQELLDRAPGSWAPCNVERWVLLGVDVPLPPETPLPDPVGCVNERPGRSGPAVTAFEPVPGDIVVDGSQMLVADEAAPIVHRFDLRSPCEPIERQGLLARSAEDPERIVRVGPLALSPLTLDLKRFLYAVDIADGSVMVFDVSDGASGTTPIESPHPEQNPFQPSDRIRFQAPVRAIVSLEHLNDVPAPTTGAGMPLRCDPFTTDVTASPGAIYQTASDYSSGASPSLLRGVFTFLILASGDIVTIDVDDYDAPCRGPRAQNDLFGCAPPLAAPEYASAEYSCQTVAPNMPRAAGFQTFTEAIETIPALSGEPILHDATGAVVQPDDETPEGRAAPRLRATVPVSNPPVPFQLVIGKDVHELNPESGRLEDPNKHALAMNLEQPRAHLVAQNWTVTYEGALPGFTGLFSALVADDAAGGFHLEEPSGRFCDRGVMSARAQQERLVARGHDPSAAAEKSLDLADFVVLTASTPIEIDSYWDEQSECSYLSCRNAFGTPELPTAARELRVVEAWQSTLLLEPHGDEAEADEDLVKCCFPASVTFSVRAGGQWVVLGDRIGLMHHVVADPETGVCRPSCAPEDSRRNGRVETAELLPLGGMAPQQSPEPGVFDGDEKAFINAFFRFAILPGWSTSPTGPHGAPERTAVPPTRGMQFQFATKGGFVPQTVSLVTTSLDVQPRAVRYLAPTGELVVSDGSLEGITLVNLDWLAVSRQFY